MLESFVSKGGQFMAALGICRNFWGFLAVCLIAQVFAFPESGVAWEGFTHDAWREISAATPPVIASPQAGHSELIPLMQSDEGGPIRSIQAWETKRDRILSVLQELIGEPTPFDPVPPYAEVLGETDQGDHLRRHLRIATEPDDWIPAYLLIPKNLPDKPMPAMIVLHQTQSPGKREPLGLVGDPDMAFAKELVKRGYLCIVPDVIGFGERIPEGTDPYHGALDFYRKHPKWTFFGKMIWDFKQVVNFLETLPEVDPYRIGSIGHSHGAYGTIMCSIFEPRISAAIASCGFNTLRTDPNPNRWSHLTALLPPLGFYVDDIKTAPFDWHEVVACLAPRPYFNWATLADDIFPNTDNLAGIYDQLHEVYGLYGAADSFEGHLVPGKHAFPVAKHGLAYDWLDRVLSPRVNTSEHRAQFPESAEQWEKLRQEIKQTLLDDIGPIDPPAGLGDDHEVLGSRNREGYVEKKIAYEVDPETRIEAYLLLPDARQEKAPGIVVYHQTVEEGKEEPAGHSGRESLQFGPELARRGYIVLIPDSITAGGRITESGPYNTEDFYRAYPNLSAMGKMIQDGRRAVSILAGVPGVDPDRIGTVGHSLGAEEALFVAAFDDRVKVAGSSCGYAPLAVEKTPERWARDHWFSYLPKVRIDLRAGRKPAWDFEEVVRLVAPRGFFNYQTREDDIFREGIAAHAMVLSCRGIWRFLGEPDLLRSRLDPGPHDIAPEGREEMFAFFDEVLKGTASKP
jgi:dienelactone hydrolase